MKLLSFLFFAGFVALSRSELVRNVPPISTNDTFSRDGRIIGGTPAALGQFPYQCVVKILISANSGSFCGCSIISPTAVLTAAHCFERGYVKVEVYAGMIAFSYFSSSAPWTATVDPSKVIIHSGYDQKSSVNDIALVIVPTIAINGNTIAAAILPSQSDDLLDLSTKVTTASGYGSIRFGANKLMFINSHVITNAACAQVYSTYFVKDTTICTAAIKKGICNGDSGGPLTTMIGTRQVLIGVTSWRNARGCGIGFPDGFARVSKYLSWISENTGIAILP